MSVILLRKLTKLSRFEQGKYKGFAVGEVLKNNKFYLIRSYFLYANITFTDDILNELQIRSEDRINKPGKDEEKIEFYFNRKIATAASELAEKKGLTDQRSIGSIQKYLKTKLVRMKSKSILIKDRINFSKRNLQARNHGKFPR